MTKRGKIIVGAGVFIGVFIGVSLIVLVANLPASLVIKPAAREGVYIRTAQGTIWNAQLTDIRWRDQHFTQARVTLHPFGLRATIALSGAGLSVQAERAYRDWAGDYGAAEIVFRGQGRLRREPYQIAITARDLRFTKTLECRTGAADIRLNLQMQTAHAMLGTARCEEGQMVFLLKSKDGRDSTIKGALVGAHLNFVARLVQTDGRVDAFEVSRKMGGW